MFLRSVIVTFCGASVGSFYPSQLQPRPLDFLLVVYPPCCRTCHRCVGYSLDDVIEGGSRVERGLTLYAYSGGDLKFIAAIWKFLVVVWSRRCSGDISGFAPRQYGGFPVVPHLVRNIRWGTNFPIQSTPGIIYPAKYPNPGPQGPVKLDQEA